MNKSMDSKSIGSVNVACGAHSNGRNGNDVAHSVMPVDGSNVGNDISMGVAKTHDGAPENFGSRTGRPVAGGTQLVPIVLPSGSAKSHEGSYDGVITTWSEDYCSVTNVFNDNQRKGKRKFRPEDDYEEEVSSHYEANRHPGEKVADNFAWVKECGWLDE